MTRREHQAVERHALVGASGLQKIFESKLCSCSRRNYKLCILYNKLFHRFHEAVKVKFSSA